MQQKSLVDIDENIDSDDSEEASSMCSLDAWDICHTSQILL